MKEKDFESYTLRELQQAIIGKALDIGAIKIRPTAPFLEPDLWSLLGFPGY